MNKTVIRPFQTISRVLIKKNQFPSRPKFSIQMESECQEKFMHGGRGPGGQKINKCNSKVQLKHLPTGIIVSCQETRSRDQNRKRAREKMALMLERDAIRKINPEIPEIPDQTDDLVVEATAEAPEVEPAETRRPHPKTAREEAIHQWKRQQRHTKNRRTRAKQAARENNRSPDQTAKEDAQTLAELLQTSQTTPNHQTNTSRAPNNTNNTNSTL